jgi:hypothetical protein
MLQASKTNGKTHRLPEIEKNLQKNFDVNLIVNFEDAIMSKKRNNNNYILMISELYHLKKF